MTIDDAADVVIARMHEAGRYLSALTLQKLLYLIQAWHLVLHERPLLDGKFEAWVHGPINRGLYDRFGGTKTLYSEVTIADVRAGSRDVSIEAREHIAAVLDTYARYSGPQLEAMNHRDEPWLRARQGLASTDQCHREIDEALMRRFYALEISKPG